jgi:hypothetical protein
MSAAGNSSSSASALASLSALEERRRGDTAVIRMRKDHKDGRR